MLQRVQVLEIDRQRVRELAINAAASGRTQGEFVILADAGESLLENVRDLYRAVRFRDFQTHLELLRNCIDLLARSEELPQRRAIALENYRTSARLVSESVEYSLEMPTAPVTPTIPRRRAARATAQGPLTSQRVTQLWAATATRISNWARPNADNAEKLIDQFVEEAEGSGYPTEDLEVQLEMVRETLKTSKVHWARGF